MKEAAISRISSALLLLRPTFLRPHKAYTRADLQGDMVAGISVAVVQIPQAMAFALIAGLPAVYGLYASLFGCIASLWGSSRQLSTGPVAMVSLLTFTSLVSLAPPGSEHFIRLAATLALLTGLIYLLLGFFRFGSMIHLVPHSVIAGFSSAAAVLIVISQIPTLLGISLPSSEIVLRNILNLVQALPHLSPIATALGIGALVILVLFRRLPHSFPSALIVLLLAILAGYGLRLDIHGVAIIGEIPSGLPHLVLPFIGVNSLALLLPKAAVLALVAFVATHANTATLARSMRERQDTDQELVGQGLANVVASFFQGYPISGSFTRSAINREAGARTSFSSVVSTGVTLATILFLTPLFFYLPLTALAAIVILSAVSLIDIKRIREMYGISRSDGLVALFTFCMVFVMKPEDALFTGMVVALLVFIRQMVWGSHVSEVGIDVEKRVLLSTIQNDQVRTFPGVVIVRVGVSLYYANTDQALTQVDGIIASHTHQGDQVKNLVLDMSGVNFVDISGMEILEEYIEKWEQQHMRISMIYVREQVFEILKNTSYFGHRNIFYNISELRTQLQLI